MHAYVKKYMHDITVIFKSNSLHNMQVFNSNTDLDSVVHHSLPKAITARCIRVHPKTWHSHISMRVEFHGCYIGKYIRAFTSPIYNQA